MMHTIAKSLQSTLLGTTLLLSGAYTLYAEDNTFELSKQRALARERVCFINAQEGRNPYVHIHDHLGGKNTSYKLAPNLSNPTVLRYTMRGFGSHTKSDIKYAGGRKNRVNEFVVDALKALRVYPKRTYEGTIFVDEYLQGMPFVMLLKSVDQLRGFAAYFKTAIARVNVATSVKPVLVLDIDKDPALSTLNSDDNAFINQYFTSIALQDPAISAYISTCWDRLKNENSELEGSHPEFVGETLSETLVRMLEKTCEEFDRNRIASALIGAFAAMVAFKYIGSPRLDCCARSVANEIKNRASDVLQNIETVIPVRS